MCFLFWVTGNWKGTVTSTRQVNPVSDLHMCETGSLFVRLTYNIRKDALQDMNSLPGLLPI